MKAWKLEANTWRLNIYDRHKSPSLDANRIICLSPYTKKLKRMADNPSHGVVRKYIKRAELRG